MVAGPEQPGSPDKDAAYAALRKKRDHAARLQARYQAQMRRLTGANTLPHAKTETAQDPVIEPTAGLEQADPALLHPVERAFATKASNVMPDAKKLTPSLTQSEARGMHRAYDDTKRIDLELRVTEINCRIETLTDIHTGKSVRASTNEIGPPGASLTWRAIAVLMKLVVCFAIPLNRVAQMIGHRSFGSSKIFRVLAQQARPLADVYLYLASQLADVSILTGDDTPTRVLAVDEEKAREATSASPPKPQDTASPKEPTDADKLVEKIDAELGWKATKKRGEGDKRTLQVSLLMGRTTQKDPRSTICFFRTHRGQLGNLITRILTGRSPKLGPVTIQSDLSSANLPSAEIQAKIRTIIAGCGAHARRPFWRYRKDDAGLCYYMLSGFFLLGQLEKLIDRRGRNHYWVGHYRRRARRIWEAMRDRCKVAVTGKIDNPARYKLLPGDHIIRWPRGEPLYKACMYVIDNYPALTRYLDDPRLEYTNNRSERGLRAEVQMLITSKFRKTRYGRAVLDILRTINATCNVAEVELADYLRYVYLNRADIEANPQHYTPYAYRLQCDPATPNS